MYIYIYNIYVHIYIYIQGWGSPIYAMVGVTSDEEPRDYDYVTYPANSVVWCQVAPIQMMCSYINNIFQYK